MISLFLLVFFSMAKMLSFFQSSSGTVRVIFTVLDFDMFSPFLL